MFDAGAGEAGAACWFPAAVSTEFQASAACRDTAEAAPPPAQIRPLPLVEIRAAHVRFPVGRRWLGRPAEHVHALNGVDLDILRGEALAVVGESGCGKSTLAQLVMGLLDPAAGTVAFDGVDLQGLPAHDLRRLRRRFQMVFQDPQGSLDPRMAAWRLIAEPLAVAGGLSRSAQRDRAGELARLVGIRDDQLDRFAHEFSGGQRQRLAIARALALDPELLVLDEPTSALDVSIQAQILNLLMELQSRLRLTYLFISHNVSVVRHVANRVAVMYLGQIVESGASAATLDAPCHPYTRQLIGAVPRLLQPLTPAPALPVESAGNLRLPTGCFFRTRCGWANPQCGSPQELRVLADGRAVRCHRAEVIRGATVP
jgi:peptide/nickel transport system ATP-binding protein